MNRLSLLSVVVVAWLVAASSLGSAAFGQGSGGATGKAIAVATSKVAVAGGPVALGPPSDPFAPTVRMLFANANELLKDLETAMSLTGPADRKEWPELKKYLDVFLIGVDHGRMARLDLILTHPIDRYRINIPIQNQADLKKFRLENLDSLGIQSRQHAANAYKLSGAFVGFLRWKHNYANIAEHLEDIPLNMQHPIDSVPHLAGAGFDAVLEGTNVADGKSSRQTASAKRRKDALTKLKKLDTETADQFAVRKAVAEGQLDEIERLYVEAERLLIGAIADSPKRQGRISVESTALADTAYAEFLKQINTKPDRYAGVGRFGNSILSGRINLPLDALHIGIVTRITAAMKTESINDVDTHKDRTADEKAAAKKVAELFYQMVDDGAKTGRLNGFVEARSNPSGKNTLVWGAVPADGTAAVAILELLPKTGRGNNAELNVDLEGDVSIHKLMIPHGLRTDAMSFFGEEHAYVGTSRETLWLAVGESALPELKSAIKQSAEKKPVDPAAPFVQGSMKLSPWTELLHKRWGKTGNVKLRERAVAAFKPGDDGLSLQMSHKDGKVTGSMELMPAVIRFVGASMAEFTRNLDKK